MQWIITVDEWTKFQNDLKSKIRSALEDDSEGPVNKRVRGNMVMEVRPSLTPPIQKENFAALFLG